MERFIGIRHRRKRTRAGEARPTQVCILARDKKPLFVDLESDDAELDFIRGQFPVEFRPADPASEDDLREIRRLRGRLTSEELAEDGLENTRQPDRSRHLKWRKLKLAKGEKTSDFPTEMIRWDDRDAFVVTKIPTMFGGFQAGDMVGMTLGGSGYYFAFASSTVGDDVGYTVWRLPPAVLKKLREDRGIPPGSVSSSAQAEEDDEEEVAQAQDLKHDDSFLIAELLMQSEQSGVERRGPFYLVTAKTREQINIGVLQKGRIEVLTECVKAEQRVQQFAVGRIFCSPAGGYPQGSIEQEVRDRIANDAIVTALRTEEAGRKKVLDEALKPVRIYKRLLDVEGMGPSIAARLITAIGDITRFPAGTKDECMTPALKAQLGVRDRLMIDGGYEAGLALIIDRDTTAKNDFQRLQMVQSAYEAAGDLRKAWLLTEAANIWEHVHRTVHVKMQQKGRNRLKAYCGAHLLNGGKHGDRPRSMQFPRRRHGEVANWNDEARKALFLFADQCNRLPLSEWGAKMRTYKAQLHAQYPQPTLEQALDKTGKPKFNKDNSPKMVKRNTPIHLQKRALRWVQTQFIEWLWGEWWRIEREESSSGGPRVPEGEPALV